MAAPEVTVEILREAAESISFEYELEPDKLYPRSKRDRAGKGYLLVSNPQGHKKQRLLLMLAKGVRRAVAKRESAKQAAAKKKETKKGKKGKRR